MLAFVHITILLVVLVAKEPALQSFRTRNPLLLDFGWPHLDKLYTTVRGGLFAVDAATGMHWQTNRHTRQLWNRYHLRVLSSVPTLSHRGPPSQLNVIV